MTRSIGRRIAAIAVAVGLALGGATLVAAPASAASPAATAFSKCMDPYLNTANLTGTNTNLRKAILYTGYARCYYNLSQRSDITSQQEIDAINNFNNYYASASIYITKTGVSLYEKWLNKYKLLGLKGL